MSVIPANKTTVRILFTSFPLGESARWPGKPSRESGPAPRVVSLLVAVGLECGLHLVRYIHTGLRFHEFLYIIVR